MSQLPKIRSYGNYASDNYGAHSLRVDIGNLSVYFSYETPIAFSTPQTGLVVRKNDWSNTTGKHLNAIDGGNKKGRITGAEFEQAFAAVLAQFGLTGEAKAA